MFTGIVEEVGQVARIERSGRLQRTAINAPLVVQDLAIGDSVSIAGACQTVVAVEPCQFIVESVAETLQRTTLGSLGTGAAVNLERALRPDSRLGGHFVLGHVDAVGHITDLVHNEDSWELNVETPPDLMRYLAPKGSVTVDGISLTVVTVTGSRFSVAVVPHTFRNTTLSDRRRGDPVNLEVDVIARYLERLLNREPPSGGLTWDELRRQGC